MADDTHFTVILTDKAEDVLNFIHKVNARLITKTLDRLARNTENQSYTALKGKHKGLFRIRCGAYCGSENRTSARSV